MSTVKRARVQVQQPSWYLMQTTPGRRGDETVPPMRGATTAKCVTNTGMMYIMQPAPQGSVQYATVNMQALERRGTRLCHPLRGATTAKCVTNTGMMYIMPLAAQPSVQYATVNMQALEHQETSATDPGFKSKGTLACK
jgi:hypothetical protein